MLLSLLFLNYSLQLMSPPLAKSAPVRKRKKIKEYTPSLRQAGTHTTKSNTTSRHYWAECDTQMRAEACPSRAVASLYAEAHIVPKTMRPAELASHGYGRMSPRPLRRQPETTRWSQQERWHLRLLGRHPVFGYKSAGRFGGAVPATYLAKKRCHRMGRYSVSVALFNKTTQGDSSSVYHHPGAPLGPEPCAGSRLPRRRC